MTKSLVLRGVGHKDTRKRCLCCGYRTLDEACGAGLCPVCWWEDERQPTAETAKPGCSVNGLLSLAEAREHFAQCEAAHPRFKPYVRKPYVTEE